MTCHAHAPASNRRQSQNAMVEGAYAHAKDDNGKIRTDEYKYEQPME